MQPRLTELLEGWQRDGQALDAVVSTVDGRTARTQVFRQSMDGPRRLRRAALALVSLWALALFSILIPVAHFLLVPGFLIAGPLVAWKRLHQEQVILGAVVTCPNCDAHTVLDPGTDERELTLSCDVCHSPLTLSTESAPSP